MAKPSGIIKDKKWVVTDYITGKRYNVVAPIRYMAERKAILLGASANNLMAKRVK